MKGCALQRVTSLQSMTSNEMEPYASLAECEVPFTIDGVFAFEAVLTISSNLLNTWWLETEPADGSLFGATLCCVLNNFSNFRWPPKYLRSRERHENRGWKSWVQTPLGKWYRVFHVLAYPPN
jgi:hypothetical protein